MKQIFKTFAMLIFVSILFTNKLNAQITLEHTFEGFVLPTFYGDGYCTCTYPDDYSYATITIYNSDYSLYKQVTIYPNEGYEMISVETLITSDLIMVNQFLYDEQYYSREEEYLIYDSNGTIIKNWGKNIYVYLLGGVESDFDVDLWQIYNDYNKLIFLCEYETDHCYTEIYSLDGYEATSENTIRSFSHAYPNPARNTISLPYNLNKGEQSEMYIYDVNGRMIDKKRIDSTFNKILLNVESYTPGIYFYSVNGISKKFVVR